MELYHLHPDHGGDDNDNSGGDNDFDFDFDYDYDVSGTHKGHDYVNLGLSVKWATCNVGASVPSDYGDQYKWGTTETNGSYTENIGDISGTNRDVAHIKWGGDWRMPTIFAAEQTPPN